CDSTSGPEILGCVNGTSTSSSRGTQSIRACLRARHQGLAQLWDRSAAIGHDRLGSALRVGPLGAEVDAQVAEDGGSQVGRRDASIFYVATLSVRAAYHLAMSQTAAGYEHRHAIGPVLATARLPLREDRRATELA